MRIATSIVLALILATTATGAQVQGDGKLVPAKTQTNRPYVSPAKHKQGGDTIADAIVIEEIPFADTGTTEGFVDDYDEVCPYTGSTSPDVVYSITPDYDQTITVDLCHSQYDTKLYIYDSDLNVVACNDDFYYGEPCGTYVSLLEFIPIQGGETYYIVVDGYGGDAGPYEINIPHTCQCWVVCPHDAVPENEPPLQDGYVDQFNGGCDALEFGAPLMDINWTNDADGIPPYDGVAMLCGRSGWFIGADGEPARDTDWFRVFARETGTMEVYVWPEFDCHVMKMSTPDCDNMDVEASVISGCWVPVTLTFSVTAGEEVWLWVGPTEFLGYTTDFTYYMTVTNNLFEVVPDEKASWGEVKALYR